MSGAQTSSSSGSSGSSASDLRRRLQDLPSSDELTPLADRVAALGRRIGRKRELFLRLHGVADRIEESDEWEEREERAGVEGSSGVPLRRPMDARTRRRARVRSGSSRCDDKAMVISRPAGPFGVSHCNDDEDDDEEDNNGDCNHDRLNPGGVTATQSTQECDYTRLPAIESTLGQQPRPTSLSEPSTARFPRRVNIETRDVRSDASFAPCSSHSRSTDLRSVSPFCFSHIRPKRKIGGYRPTPGVLLKNLKSDSDSGSVKETSRCHPVARRMGDSIATLELSSPELKTADEPTKKMPIMSARSDITESILPNLLPSVLRRNDDYQIHCDDSSRCSALEDSYDEEAESYRSRLITPEAHRDDLKDHLGFDRLIKRSNNGFCKAAEDYSPEIVEEVILETVEESMETYMRETGDSPRSTGRIPNDTEEALSSQTSEPFGSEGHSRSSHTPKMYRQKEVLSSGRYQNDTDVSDKYDQNIATVTNVPMLALNSSQDISCSTSAYSRECSAVQPLDPHELIQVLSAVSLQQGKGRDGVRKCEDPQGKDTIDASRRVSCFAAKGETWRVPSSSTLQSSERAPSRVPSRIPIKVTSSTTKLSECCAISECSVGKIANYEEARLADSNDIPTGLRRGIVPRQLDVNSCYRVHGQDPLPRSRKNGVEVTVVETSPDMFIPKDEEVECEVNEREYTSLPSTNPPSPQSAELGHNLLHEAQFPVEDKCNEKSYPLVFCPNEVAFSGNQDFSKIDDDLQSPCLSRCRNDEKSNQSSQVESARNVEENVTWQTEDEWVSNNDEEYPDDEEDKGRSRDGKSEVVFLRRIECLGSTELCDPASAEIPQPLRSSRSEMAKIVKDQRVENDSELGKDKSNFGSEPSKIARSENSVLQLRRTQEICSFVAQISSSMLNLSDELKRKKRKSQERFPFTISEAPAARAVKRESAIDYQVLDKDLHGEKMDDQLKEKTSHQLKMHPSITRLANAGLEDTFADILYCVAQDQKEEELSSKSRIKSFMQMFSSKFRRFSQQRSDVRITKPAEVIYKNQACQVDSKANSCSEYSSTEETHRTSYDKSLNRNVYRFAKSNPTLIFEGNVLRKTSSLTAIPQHPYRRHDRDDLWVRGFKETPLESVKNNKTSWKQDQVDDSKDRYSIFLAKTLHSDKKSVPDIDRGNSPEVQQQQHDALISGHIAPLAGKSRNIDVDIIPEIDEIEEVLSGCFCLRLCRLITQSKHRLSIRKQVSSSKRKNSGLFLWKKK